MALTSIGIEQARERFVDISNDVLKLTELKDVVNFMSSNDEFSRFVSGTKFGNENYEKWQKLLNLISSDLYQALTNLDAATKTFLERQEQYNSSMTYGVISDKKVGTTDLIDNNLDRFTFLEKEAPRLYNEPVYGTPGFKPGENNINYTR